MAVGFEWPADAGYEAFVREHARTLLRLAVLLTGNRYDADDVLQEAVIAAAGQWPRIRRETALAYLRTTVTRKAIDLSRRHSHLPLGDEHDLPIMDLGYLRTESAAEFVRLLQDVPERQRAVLVLRYWADLDDRTIARTLGCSVGTVRSQASRALARLRERMARPATTPGGDPDGSD